jgi:hypothetical protein
VQLGISAVTFGRIRTFLFRSRHERGLGQKRLRTDQIAEQIAWWRAFRTILPELRQKPIFTMVSEELGLSRSEVCAALREVDAEQWKQLRANADALAKEWADARRRTNAARRRYANTVRRTSQSGGFDARM